MPLVWLLFVVRCECRTQHTQHAFSCDDSYSYTRTIQSNFTIYTVSFELVHVSVTYSESMAFSYILRFRKYPKKNVLQ